MKLALPFLLAYLLDLLLGDPPGWPHPVRLLGRIIQYWESTLYQDRVGAGALFWLAVMGTTFVLIFGVLLLMALLPPWAGVAVLTYFSMPAWPPAASTRRVSRWKRLWSGVMWRRPGRTYP